MEKLIDIVSHHNDEIYELTKQVIDLRMWVVSLGIFLGMALIMIVFHTCEISSLKRRVSELEGKDGAE